LLLWQEETTKVIKKNVFGFNDYIWAGNGHPHKPQTQNIGYLA
jgi:hypothetical protein